MINHILVPVTWIELRRIKGEYRVKKNLLRDRYNKRLAKGSCPRTGASSLRPTRTMRRLRYPRRPESESDLPLSLGRRIVMEEEVFTPLKGARPAPEPQGVPREVLAIPKLFAEDSLQDGSKARRTSGRRWIC